MSESGAGRLAAVYKLDGAHGASAYYGSTNTRFEHIAMTEGLMTKETMGEHYKEKVVDDPNVLRMLS